MGKNTGQIIKSKSTERFTVITNDIIQSRDLTLEEKGFLTYLLHLPSDWVVYRQNLYNALSDSKGTIDRLFRSLQAKGYVVSVRVHGDSGKFEGWNHVVYDTSVYNRDKDLPRCTFTDLGESGPILNTNTYTTNTNIHIPISPDVEINALFDAKVRSNKKLKTEAKNII